MDALLSHDQYNQEGWEHKALSTVAISKSQQITEFRWYISESHLKVTSNRPGSLWC